MDCYVYQTYRKFSKFFIVNMLILTQEPSTLKQELVTHPHEIKMGRLVFAGNKLDKNHRINENFDLNVALNES